MITKKENREVKKGLIRIHKYLEKMLIEMERLNEVCEYFNNKEIDDKICKVMGEYIDLNDLRDNFEKTICKFAINEHKCDECKYKHPECAYHRGSENCGLRDNVVKKINKNTYSVFQGGRWVERDKRVKY